jgi:hypothetical protein
MRIDLHAPVDCLREMTRPRGYSFVFHPNELYPRHAAPRPLFGWQIVSADDGAIVYVNRELERAAIARMPPPRRR